jgi:hypothetical protein
LAASSSVEIGRPKPTGPIRRFMPDASGLLRHATRMSSLPPVQVRPPPPSDLLILNSRKALPHAVKFAAGVSGRSFRY